jgi:hypothetical protein
MRCFLATLCALSFLAFLDAFPGYRPSAFLQAATDPTNTAPAIRPPDWKHPLSLDGGGWSSGRIRVVVKNETLKQAAGQPVAVRVGNAPGEADLAGQRAEAIRVCDGHGQEMLFALQNPQGDLIKRGPIAAGSTLLLPAECAARQTANYDVYFDNPDAWELPDWLAAKLGTVNGDLEQGDGDAPKAWSHDAGDAHHRATWSTERPESGKRCLKTVVDVGAAPTWIATRQSGIHITGGAKYRLSAWVKADGVKGRVGWYIHVGTALNPMLLTPDLVGPEGTYDWKQLTAEFVAPAEADRADLGTMLYGTGTAWFDNVRLECLEPERLTAVAEKPQRISLTHQGGDTTWNAHLPGPAEMWNRRVTMRVCNVSSQAALEGMVSIDTTMFDARTPGGVAKYMLVTDAGKPIPCHRFGGSLLVKADTPPMTARTLQIYWCGEPSLLAQTLDIPDNAAKTNAAPLPGNLIKNPEFALGDPMPADWTHDPVPPDSGVTFGVEDPGRASVGKRCVKMHVPPKTPAGWRGWHQTVQVQPNRTYLVAAWVKCENITGGEINLHVHRHRADGGESKDGLASSVGPALKDTADWTLLSGLLTMPEDTTSVSLHLTMNATGTLWHGGVAVVEVTPAMLAKLEGKPASDPNELKLWPVPAVVKVFQDDPPPHKDAPARISAARNEREPLQVAIRSGRTVSGVRVEVDPPLGPNGAKLGDLEVNVVGYVPIDYATNYYQSKTPAWHRKIPTQAIGCDGWRGWWPDPLLPNRAFDLAANTTQPVWITVNVPKDAVPGDYTGAMRLVADGRPLAQMPFAVHVRNFALPEENHVMAKYETGPGDGEKWWGKPWNEMHGEILEFMARRRLSPRGGWPDPTFEYKDGRIKADFTQFDKAAEHCFNELKMPFAWTPHCFYAFGWGLTPYAIFGEQPYAGEPPFEKADRDRLRPEYKRAYQACLKAFWDHVKAKGWDKRFVLYVSDEPFYWQPHIIKQMQAVCRMIHEVDPQIPIYASTWQHVPQWDDSLDVWGIGHYGTVSVEQIAKLRAAGKRIWWTTDGQMCTDTPYCAVERLLPHYCFKYGVEAYEFWGACWTTYEPNQFGWHAYIPQSDQPGVSYWVRYPNGDGFLIYPGHPVGVPGPMSTVRLEQAREGMEDYEYLYLLRDRVARAKSAGKDTAEAEQALERADRLVTIPNAGGRYSSKILLDPNEVYLVREQIAAAIERLASD